MILPGSNLDIILLGELNDFLAGSVCNPETLDQTLHFAIVE